MKNFEFTRYGAFSDDSVTIEELGAWSSQFGFPLPDRYVAFMVKNNGGSIKPSVFEHQHPQIQSIAAIQELYDWKTVVKHSRLDRPPEKRSVAPDHLIIGATTVDDEIVLRLHPSAPGGIFLIGHNTYPNWTSDGEDEFGLIANDFNTFIDGLREPTPDDAVYLGIWDPKRNIASRSNISSISI
ncbi:MAG: SMI1/KNR4 family protein [Desulfobacterales bacterium]|nr:SMI1/KNR4 family protein [Desulfobacterales bacterium]